jgi:chemotaxis protein histidine kinase CheA
MLPEFFATWDRDLCNAQSDVVAQHDTEALYRFGHTIKGSMIQFGFRGLSAIGVAIMQDAEHGDFAAAGLRISGLRQQLQDLQKTFV